MLEEQALTL